VNGGPAPGYSTGQAQKAMEEVARAELPNDMRFEWTELTYQQVLAGDTAAYVFPLVILLVFMVLGALYESVSLPLVVILIVPMCLLSAILGVQISGGDNNVFTQIGLIVLVGSRARTPFSSSSLRAIARRRARVSGRRCSMPAG